MILESKSDNSKLVNSLPDCQFLIQVFGTAFCFDRSWNGGVLCFFGSDIIAADENPFDIFYVEVNAQKKKWL